MERGVAVCDWAIVSALSGFIKVSWSVGNRLAVKVFFN
jgi:hypothetical protein